MKKILTEQIFAKMEPGRFTVDRDRMLSAKGRSHSVYRLKRVASDIDLQKCRCQCTCEYSMRSPMSSSMTELVQRDADGQSQTPCRLHRRSALRRVQTLNPEPSSPRSGRNRQRSPSTPNAPDPKMLTHRGQDLGGGGRDSSKFMLTFDLEGNKETVRLPASKDNDLKEILEEALSKKGLKLPDIDIYISSTNTNPLPKTDKALRVSTEPLGGLEVFIKAAKEKSSSADTCPLDELPGTTTTKKKDLSAFLGVKDDVSSKVGPRDRRMSVPAIVSAQMDPKMNQLKKELDHYQVQGLPGFPPLLSMQYQRDKNEDPQLLYMEDTWKDLIDIDIQATMTKKNKEVQESIWEILNTEAKYIRNIRVIIDLYMCCLLNLQTEAILNEIETEKIFSNITDLDMAHTNFWKTRLKKIMDKARSSGKPFDPNDIATAFETFADDFTPYFKFCAEEASCLEYVRTKRAENDILRAFFEWCEAHTISRKLRLQGLSHLLVYPMQRVTKYHLIVERVIKCCEDASVKEALQWSFESIKGFVSHINHEIKKEQERTKMERIASVIEGYDTFNAPTGCEELNRLVESHSMFDVTQPMPPNHIHPRWLLLEGPLKLTEKSGRSTLYAFLFTDVLMLAKPTGRSVKDAPDRYRIVRPPLRIDQLEVVELKDASGFAVLCVDEYDCAVTGFVAQPERESASKWMEKIGQAKEWYQNACTMEEEDYYGDAPVEEPDTPVIALMEDRKLHPDYGFQFHPSPGISPHNSPVMERASRRRSNSPSHSQGSNSSSSQRLNEEDEHCLSNGTDKKLMGNGRSSSKDVQENNSNNHLDSNGKEPPKTLPKPTLKVAKSYQETDFIDDKSLLGDIVTEMPSNEHKSKLISTARQLSVDTSITKEVGLTASPVSPNKIKSPKIMSFESDEEDEDKHVGKDKPQDIYDKNLSPTRKKVVAGGKLAATNKIHRPSMPNIHIMEKKKEAASPAEKKEGTSTLKKKSRWLSKNVKVTSV